MPLLGFTEAAKLAGVDVSTIHRRVKRGEISATRQPNGRRVIDLAELLRVYPDLAQASGTPPGAPPDAPGHTVGQAPAPATAATLALLERELAAARDREARLLAMLEAEQQARRDLELRLLPGPHRGWWRRLFRRE